MSKRGKAIFQQKAVIRCIARESLVLFEGRLKPQCRTGSPSSVDAGHNCVLAASSLCGTIMTLSLLFCREGGASASTASCCGHCQEWALVTLSVCVDGCEAGTPNGAGQLQDGVQAFRRALQGSVDCTTFMEAFGLVHVRLPAFCSFGMDFFMHQAPLARSVSPSFFTMVSR